jgi:hypothetical protein
MSINVAGTAIASSYCAGMTISTFDLNATD